MTKARSKAPVQTGANQSSQGAADASGSSTPAAAAETAGAATEAVKPAADLAPVAEVATGTASQDQPQESERTGGTGAMDAGTAEAFDALEASLNAHEGEPGYLERLEANLTAAEAAFRASYPASAAAIDAWQATEPHRQPVAIRISSRIEGFRRAGIAHTKAAVDHPLTAFATPELLEQLFAEPNLVAEFV